MCYFTSGFQYTSCKMHLSIAKGSRSHVITSGDMPIITWLALIKIFSVQQSASLYRKLVPTAHLSFFHTKPLKFRVLLLSNATTHKLDMSCIHCTNYGHLVCRRWEALIASASTAHVIKVPKFPYILSNFGPFSKCHYFFLLKAMKLKLTKYIALAKTFKGCDCHSNRLHFPCSTHAWISHTFSLIWASFQSAIIFACLKLWHWNLPSTLPSQKTLRISIAIVIAFILRVLRISEFPIQSLLNVVHFPQCHYFPRFSVTSLQFGLRCHVYAHYLWASSLLLGMNCLRSTHACISHTFSSILDISQFHITKTFTYGMKIHVCSFQ